MDKETLFHFRRQTGKGKQTEFSVGPSFVRLILTLVAILIGHALIPTSFWQLLKMVVAALLARSAGP